ncbi:NAD(P)-dependent oxidoreductase [Kitasatospora sp. NA04385]|uniref:NAD-dependent epimerase/dehydratase family protein n=1 Tax=Kitasatospora sp. NA04385 TaxID=2742135 RepID=UPI0020CABD2B|nr:NAD(P)-dependent oxidoreductase [Kitasatospora sp. NA04385]
MTGATGFLGSAVVSQLALQPVDLRLGMRLPRPAGDKGLSGAEAETGGEGPPRAGGEPLARVHRVRADLDDRASLDALCADADVVLHLASYVGPDRDRAEAVNHRGAERLAAAARATARPHCRILHLSTCAVYGAGPHRGAAVGEVVPDPVSPASRTRLAGERATRAAGATVLRAALVTGPGERWVVPALRELVHRVPAHWDGGRALLSMIDAADLGRLVAALALEPAAAAPGAVLHAAHPAPVRNRDLLRALADLGLLPPLPDGADRPWSWCLDRLARTPGSATERQLALLGQDHWYRSEDAWRLARTDPGPGPLARLAAAAPWYRAHLALPGG